MPRSSADPDPDAGDIIEHFLTMQLVDMADAELEEHATPRPELHSQVSDSPISVVELPSYLEQREACTTATAILVTTTTTTQHFGAWGCSFESCTPAQSRPDALWSTLAYITTDTCPYQRHSQCNRCA